ncbi:MAG: hypothetical protein U0359_04835 [Byssovorax sp.]
MAARKSKGAPKKTAKAGKKAEKPAKKAAKAPRPAKKAAAPKPAKKAAKKVAKPAKKAAKKVAKPAKKAAKPAKKAAKPAKKVAKPAKKVAKAAAKPAKKAPKTAPKKAVAKAPKKGEKAPKAAPAKAAKAAPPAKAEKPAKKTSLPAFGQDRGQYGVLLAGRRYERALTANEVAEVAATVAAWEKKTGLPLALINPGMTWDKGPDDEATECFYVGLVLAHAKDGGPPVVADKKDLDVDSVDRVPAALFADLEEKHDLSFGEGDEDEDDDDDDEDDDGGEAEGLFLVPAGWAEASLHLGQVLKSDGRFRVEGELLATTASEDTVPGKLLDDELLEKVLDTSDALILVGSYC